ncbi:MAG: glutathione S-transferase family protein [Gammaproteobacteria bacterium]|nr:glutathione S-transferase family protein [Gammaproteobacteria bacterium]
MVNLELVSFNVCPFVQRSVITLNHKDCEYKITFIDLGNPPDWFRQISPLGKVPVLKVNDSEVLFESAVINEFVDDVTPGTLKPSDPLTLAKNRAWIEFGGTCLADLYMMADAKTKSEMHQQMNVCKERLQYVENILTDAVFFNGDDFALIDAAYAPLLIRLESISGKIDFLDWRRFPKLDRWKENLLTLGSVQKSVIEDFESHYTNKIRAQNGYLGSLL